MSTKLSHCHSDCASEDKVSDRGKRGLHLHPRHCVCCDRYSLWKQFLQFSRNDVVSEACKWWFHLYGLCKDQPEDTQNGNSSNNLKAFGNGNSAIRK